jgi:hypothetical protein
MEEDTFIRSAVGHLDWVSFCTTYILVVICRDKQYIQRMSRPVAPSRKGAIQYMAGRWLCLSRREHNVNALAVSLLTPITSHAHLLPQATTGHAKQQKRTARKEHHVGSVVHFPPYVVLLLHDSDRARDDSRLVDESEYPAGNNNNNYSNNNDHCSTASAWQNTARR